MKTFFALMVCFGMAGAASAAFEGVIDYEIRSPKEKVFPMTYKIKGSKVRMDYGDGMKGAGILDSSAKVMWVLQPGRKTAIKMDLPKAPAGKDAKMEFRKTGRTETVAGRRCAIYTFKGENVEGESCNAEGMGTFMMAEGFGDGMSGWQKEAMAKGLFPLKVVTKNTGSNETTTLIATRINERKLLGSDFEVPADYKVIDGVKAMAAPAMGKDAMMEKMMNATPAERQKMVEEMKRQYGGGK